MNKFAYVTLATEDKYLEGAHNLYLSYLRTNSKYPFVCMVWDEVDIAKYPDMPTVLVSKVHRMDTFLASWTRILSKVDIWEMLDYEYVLFLDADILFYKNIDNLVDRYINMNLNDKQILGCSVCTDGIKRCWGGMLFVHPNLSAYRTAISYIANYYTDEDLWKALAVNKEFEFIYDDNIVNYIFHFPNQLKNGKLCKYWQTPRGQSMFSEFIRGYKTIEDIKILSEGVVFEGGEQT